MCANTNNTTFFVSNSLFEFCIQNDKNVKKKKVKAKATYQMNLYIYIYIKQMLLLVNIMFQKLNEYKIQTRSSFPTLFILF